MRRKLILVVCYDRIEKWHRRENAIRFYAQGVEECDGAEAERYAHVLADLYHGCEVATDGASLTYGECKARGLYRFTTAPDGSRDWGDDFWFPERPC